MISIIPYYKKERKSIIIRIISDGQVAKVLHTGIKVSENQWDPEGKKVIVHQNKNIFNQKIQIKIGELHAIFTKAELLGVKLTKDRIKNLAEGGEVTQDFYKHCEAWIKEKYSNQDTADAAMSDLRKVNKYSPSLQFGDIDKRFLIRYEKYLREELKNEGNTPWKAMKFMRTMLYDAQEVLGMHIKNPFKEKEYKMPKYIQPHKDGLTTSELDQIEKLLTEPHPVVIKLFAAKFLFMCYIYRIKNK